MTATSFFPRGTLLFLMAAALFCSMTLPQAQDLPHSPDDIQPLQPGALAPSFAVKTVDGADWVFDPGSLEKPVMIISFRGGWCPYCNLHLSDLRHVIPDIRSLGYDVLFISNDRHEALYDGLEAEAAGYVDTLDYLILSDADIAAAKAFGTAYRESKDYVRKLDSYGKDYAGGSIDKHLALAVPAVFIVGTDGKVGFSYADPNYRARIDNADLLQAAEANAAP